MIFAATRFEERAACVKADGLCFVKKQKRLHMRGAKDVNLAKVADHGTTLSSFVNVGFFSVLQGYLARENKPLPRACIGPQT